MLREESPYIIYGIIVAEADRYHRDDTITISRRVCQRSKSLSIVYRGVQFVRLDAVDLPLKN